ncbi:MAG: sensor histidine kinase [Clostridiales bacterium]|jgi:signal transduction histidine kinase|nr:sensor histidine kinase [Clostridiales bacterium]
MGANENRAKNIRNYLPLIVLPLALIIVLALWANLTQREIAEVRSVDGVWDLRDVDFYAGGPILLSGVVEMLPSTLLCPAEFAARQDEAVLLGGVPGDFATSRMRILLPEDRIYSFARMSLSFNQRLYVNGELVMNMGVPGETRETSVQELGYIFFTAYPIDGMIEIVQQSSNFVHRVQHWHHSIYIGVGPMDFIFDTIAARSVIMGGFFAIFLMYIMLYFLLNRQKANLYFALFCLAWCIRVGVMRPLDPGPFNFLFPQLSWEMGFRMEYIFTLPAQSILLVLIINILFPGVLQRFFRRLVYIVASLAALSFIFLDTIIMSVYLAHAAYAVLSATLLYIVMRFAMKIRRVNLAQGIFLGGIGMMVYFALAEFLGRLGIVSLPLHMGQETSVIIALMFTLCAAAAIFINTSSEVNEAKESERRLAEKNLLLDRLNRTKSEFLQDMNHEIRTPLTVIASGIDYVDGQIDENDENMQQTRAALETIRNQTQRIGRMLSGMAALADMGEPGENRKRVNFTKLLENTVEAFRIQLDKHGNSLHVDIAPDLPDIFVEYDRFAQVIVNLMANAAQNLQDGQITVTAHLNNRASFIVVRVKDNGDGIAPEILPRIFERGVSGRGSTGYGLFICKTVVEAHGGSIEIQSEQGAGTTATFTVPVYGGQEAGHE